MPLDTSQFKTGAEFIDYVRRNGGMATDGKLPPDFTSAWGKPFGGSGETAHYFTADRRFDLGEGAFGAVAECGVKTVYLPPIGIFGPGNYPFCTRCENKLMRKTREGAKP